MRKLDLAEIRYIDKTYKCFPKKIMRSFDILKKGTYFTRVTLWVPDTPEDKRAPCIAMTITDSYSKFTLYFPSGEDVINFITRFYNLTIPSLPQVIKALQEARKEWEQYHGIKRTYRRSKNHTLLGQSNNSVEVTQKLLPFKVGGEDRALPVAITDNLSAPPTQEGPTTQKNRKPSYGNTVPTVTQGAKSEENKVKTIKLRHYRITQEGKNLQKI